MGYRFNHRGDSKDNPCTHCADRSVGCHGTCKDHFEWKAKEAKKKEEAKKTVAMSVKIYNSDYDPPGYRGRKIK